VPGPVIVNGECKIHAAEVVQCIRPRPAAPVVDASDVAVMRYDLARDMKCMLDRQTLTDTSVTVEGLHERWQVHRIVLASASPVFRQAFECDAAHLDCDQQGGHSHASAMEQDANAHDLCRKSLRLFVALCTAALQCCWVHVHYRRGTSRVYVQPHKACITQC